VKIHSLLALPGAALIAALLFGGTACRSSQTAHQSFLLEKYAAAWNTATCDGLEAVLHPDYEMRYAPDFSVHVKGLAAFRKEMIRLRGLSFTVAIDEAIYGIDTITLRWTCSATYPNSTGGPPKTARATGLSLIHLKDGKIADEWIAYDLKAWMEQLGFEMKPK
jgi:hypothetical protein